MSAGHIRPRGPGAWEIRYDVGRDPLSGKRVTKTASVRGAKRAAQRELRDRLSALDKGQHVDPGKLTLGAWLAQWLEEARHGTSGKTLERYREIVNKHLVPALGALPLAKLQRCTSSATTARPSRAADVMARADCLRRRCATTTAC